MSLQLYPASYGAEVRQNAQDTGDAGRSGQQTFDIQRDIPCQVSICAVIEVTYSFRVMPERFSLSRCWELFFHDRGDVARLQDIWQRPDGGHNKRC